MEMGLLVGIPAIQRVLQIQDLATATAQRITISHVDEGPPP